MITKEDRENRQHARFEKIYLETYLDDVRRCPIQEHDIVEVKNLKEIHSAGKGTVLARIVYDEIPMFTKNGEPEDYYMGFGILTTEPVLLHNQVIMPLNRIWIDYCELTVIESFIGMTKFQIMKLSKAEKAQKFAEYVQAHEETTMDIPDHIEFPYVEPDE